MLETPGYDYARAKLLELTFELFTSLAPAREKLSDNLHFIAIISPNDFKLEKHRRMWTDLQGRLLGKTRNIGLERHPTDRLTVRNSTLAGALRAIYEIHHDIAIEP